MEGATVRHGFVGSQRCSIDSTLRVAYAGSGVAQDAAHLYTTGMEHSPTSATGTAWERTAWRATQRAAWQVLHTSRSSTESF